MAWAIFLSLFPAALLLGCTPGNLTEPSSGWSPVAAAPIPTATGVFVNEAAGFGPLDNQLAYAGSYLFTIGQVIEIGGEQMRITGVAFSELTVERGIDGAQPVTHPDRSEIMLLAGDMAVYVGSKQGSVKSFRDDGSGLPSPDWIYSPAGLEQ